MDDGSPTLGESIKMLQQAQKLGITTIFATPHYQENIFELESMEKNFLQVAEKAREYGITLKMGSEVYINPFVDKLVKENKFLMLNRSSYILIELPYESIPLYTLETIYKLQLQRISVIIAHPERNMNLLQDFSKYVGLLQRGCLMQVDIGSIVGVYGKAVEEYSKKLIKRKMVHFVASDAHFAKDYEQWYLKAFKKVYKWVGTEYAKKLFIYNPQLILDDTKESIYDMV